MGPGRGVRRPRDAGTKTAGTKTAGPRTAGGRPRRLAASAAAPETDAEHLPWLPLEKATVLDPAGGHAVPSAWTDLDTELAACPLGDGRRVVVLGRPGGPFFRPSELARLAHLCGILAVVMG